MISPEERTPLAKNLVALRKKNGLTQANVASAVGVERSRYAHYEKNTTPPATVLKKLAVVFNVSTDELLYTPEHFLRFNEYNNPYNNHYLPIVFGELLGEEKEFILKLRLLPKEERTAVMKFLEEKIDKLDM